MERAPSPIKNWMQRHSPIKSRNKPLPVPPPEDTHNSKRKPISQVSGNARPSSADQQEKPKRRLSSLFKSTTEKTASAATTTSATPLPGLHSSRGHHYTSSAPGQQLRRELPSPNLRNLSAKVNCLEEQLREAREQLDSYASTSRRSRHEERPPARGKGPRTKPTQPVLGDDQYSNLYLQNNLRFDGIVESLLLQQQQQEHRQRHARSGADKARSIQRRRSADMGDAFAHYRQTLDAYEEARDQCATAYASDGEAEAEENSPGQLKRKRSQIRASSWQAVQDYAARETLSRQWDRHAGARPAAGQEQQSRRAASDSERPTQRLKQQHDKSLPKSPPKSPSPTPRKAGGGHRRSGSKTKNELPPQDGAGEDGQQRTTAGEPRVARPISPSKRYASSPLKLLPVAEEFEWDDEVF